MYKILITNQDTEEVVLKATALGAEGVVTILAQVIRLRTEDDAAAKMDSEIDELIEEPPKKRKYSKKETTGGGKRKKSTCSICGEVGHNVKTCPKESPERYGFEKDGDESAPRILNAGDKIEITQNIKERVNFLIREGGGITVVMEEYELTRPEAVRLVARVKNVKVPDEELEGDSE